MYISVYIRLPPWLSTSNLDNLAVYSSDKTSLPPRYGSLRLPADSQAVRSALSPDMAGLCGSTPISPALRLHTGYPTFGGARGVSFSAHSTPLAGQMRKSAPVKSGESLLPLGLPPAGGPGLDMYSIRAGPTSRLLVSSDGSTRYSAPGEALPDGGSDEARGKRVGLTVGEKGNLADVLGLSPASGSASGGANYGIYVNAEDLVAYKQVATPTAVTGANRNSRPTIV
ncbi:unnamed protein product [Protopolystoma xenopodis]|uniref:Uncharacterized protein n=1 Tax=Protopolystoma xenopodis TaxID=117903 RepID=A0A3S5B1H5_9PLAT|nr:unnamed protein product [Protopolystoma xenopodis]